MPPLNRSASSHPAPPARGGFLRSLWRWTKRIVIATILLVVATPVAVFFLVRHYEKDLPSTDEIKEGRYRPPQVTRVLARDGTLLAELFTERRTVVPIDSLPPHVKIAVLAAEDARFYQHEGLNYLGMLRAVLVNLQSGRSRQGASTITQQVVKNTLLDPERTYTRKIREALLARRIEQELSKDQILELYLNQIYLGHGRYGIEEAARFHFGCSASALTLSQAATLAGTIASPESYSPRKSPAKAEVRRRFVLGQMETKGFISPEMKAAALEEPIVVATAQTADSELAPEVVEIVKRTLQQVAGDQASLGGYTVTTTIDPKLQEQARKSVRANLENYDERNGQRAPFTPPKTAPKKGSKDAPFEGTPRFEDHKVLVGTVTGWDDEHLLLYVQVGDTKGVVRLDDHARYNPKKLAPSKFATRGSLLRVSLLAPAHDPKDATAIATESAPGTKPEGIPGSDAPQENPQDTPKAAEEPAPVPLRLELGPQSALVAIDVRTREVLALVGNYEAIQGGLDRATQARRQPASTFKPIVYSYALQSRRYTAATLVDTRAESVLGITTVDEDNAARTDMVRLREALAKSVNVAAVHVAKQVGPANVVTWAKALGLTTPMQPDLSLPLGSYEARPIEMANVYASFASGGMFVHPKLVTRIQDPRGNDVALPPPPVSRRVMEESEAFLITSLMTSVVDHGTGQAAKSLGRPVAGKTGTSNEAKDAWFVGYSTDIAVAVWTGYDDAKPLGKREAGATAALPAWISFMKAAHTGKPAAEFPRPADITAVRIDPTSGLLPIDGQETTLLEFFLRGTEPTERVVVDAPEDAPPTDHPEVLEVPPPQQDTETLPALPPPEDPGLPTLL